MALEGIANCYFLFHIVENGDKGATAPLKQGGKGLTMSLCCCLNSKICPVM